LGFGNVQIYTNVLEYITVCIFRVHLREYLMSYKKEVYKKEGKKENGIEKKVIKANYSTRMETKCERWK